MAENDERTRPGGRTPGDDELGDRIARARASIDAGLREVARQVEREETALRERAAADLARVAAGELGRAVAELTRASDALIERRLGEAVERLNETAAAREGSLGSRRHRRHELKLARAESSRRVSRALTKLERRGGTLLGELDSRAAAAAERIEQAEVRLRAATDGLERAEGAAARQLAATLREVDQVAGQVGTAQERVVAIEARALGSATRAQVSAELGGQAAALQSRLREAAELETRAAERIEAAERRLLALIRA